MLILGHRGASADAPENTLPSFQLAAAQGADGVELDAMVCGSGEVVVCHDPRLDRLAGVDWEVARTPLSKLRTLDVGKHLGRGSAGIPLLTEVLEALPVHLLVNIELKCERWDDGGLTLKVGRLVTDRKWEERVVISSFNGALLWRLSRAFPRLRHGYLIDPDLSFLLHGRLLPPFLCNYSIHPFDAACTPGNMRAWLGRGWKVATWTVDDVTRAKELKALGVTHLITNRPGALRAALAG